MYSNLLSSRGVSTTSPTLRERFVVNNISKVLPHYKQKYRTVN